MCRLSYASGFPAFLTPLSVLTKLNQTSNEFPSLVDSLKEMHAAPRSAVDKRDVFFLQTQVRPIRLGVESVDGGRGDRGHEKQRETRRRLIDRYSTCHFSDRTELKTCHFRW